MALPQNCQGKKQLLSILICSNHFFGGIIQCDLPSQWTSELIWCPFLLTKPVQSSPLRGKHTHQWDCDAVFCANRPVDAPLRVNDRDEEQWICAEEMCPWEERYCLWWSTGNLQVPLTPLASNKTNHTHVCFRARLGRGVIAVKLPIIKPVVELYQQV